MGQHSDPHQPVTFFIRRRGHLSSGETPNSRCSVCSRTFAYYMVSVEAENRCTATEILKLEQDVPFVDSDRCFRRQYTDGTKFL